MPVTISSSCATSPPNRVYIWINNDKVEIRDASHLKGKGALETQDLIRKELKEPKAQVAAIGLAGENRVFTASIEQGKVECQPTWAAAPSWVTKG